MWEMVCFLMKSQLQWIDVGVTAAVLLFVFLWVLRSALRYWSKKPSGCEASCGRCSSGIKVQERQQER
jgi:hypothetical protein